MSGFVESPFGFRKSTLESSYDIFLWVHLKGPWKINIWEEVTRMIMNDINTILKCSDLHGEQLKTTRSDGSEMFVVIERQ